MLKQAVKTLAFRVLGSAPAIRARLEQSAKTGRTTVLNFHRVAPDDGSTYEPLSPDLFEDVVRFCKERFDLTTFAEMERPHTSNRPRAIISFDDGYADFMEFSDPILRRHGVRANHNVIAGCVETGRPPYSVIVQDYLGQTGDEESLHALVGTARGPAFGLRMAADLKNRTMAEQHELMAALQPLLDDPKRGFRPTPMMTLSDWKEAARYHEVGAHSFEHANLAVETDDYVRADGQRCRAWLADEMGLETPIYALPYGDGRAGVEELLAESGFTTILYTGERFATPANLNRFTMYGTSRAEMRARATGWTRH